MRWPAYALAILLTAPHAAAQITIPPFPPGSITPSVACQDNPSQTYALYLPSTFSLNRRWPIIYVFDPGARGQVAAGVIQAAAEKYGYIIAASNNSRNGPTGGSLQAADAVWRDTQLRLPIDEHRRYFAGMSGGARVASQLALACHGSVAGVIANAAGFPVGMAPSRDVSFAYFGAVGNADFNYPEFAELRRKLEDAGLRYRIRVFEGRHGWAPAEVWMEALNWMDFQAMVAGTLPRDQGRIQHALEDDLARAGQLRAATNTLEAFREYQGVIRDFTGLADVSSAKTQLDELRNSKALKAAEKEERRAIELQNEQSARPSAQMQAIGSGDLSSADFMELRNNLAALKKQASDSTKARDGQTVVTMRVLGQLVVQAFESGQSSLERKNYSAALLYFDLFVAGAENAAWGHYQRARVYALKSDEKNMLRELEQARGVQDVSALDAEEFKAYRERPEFQEVVKGWREKGP
jgi:dienelactone hydrolase